MNNKILCVDDEDSILRGFQLNLRKDFELHLASDGVEGLEVFEKEGGFVKGIHSTGDLDPDKRFIMHFPGEKTIRSIGSGF